MQNDRGTKFDNKQIDEPTFTKIVDVIKNEVILSKNGKKIIKLDKIYQTLKTTFYTMAIICAILFVLAAGTTDPETAIIYNVVFGTTIAIIWICLTIPTGILFLVVINLWSAKRKLLKSDYDLLDNNDWNKIYKTIYDILDPNSEFEFKEIKIPYKMFKKLKIEFNNSSQMIFTRKNLEYIFSVNVKTNSASRADINEFTLLKYSLRAFTKNTFLTGPFVLKILKEKEKSICSTESINFDKKFYFTAQNEHEALRVLNPKVIMSYLDLNFLPNAIVNLLPEYVSAVYSEKLRGHRMDLGIAKFKNYRTMEAMILGFAREIIEDFDKFTEARKYITPLIKNNIF